MFEKSIDKNKCSVYNKYNKRTNVPIKERMIYMKRIVIKNKVRFITFLLIVFTILSVTCVSIFNLGKVYSESPVEFITYYVESGDTLWEIAEENNIHNRDIRKLIHEIKEINNIGTSLSIGQEIIIPL